MYKIVHINWIPLTMKNKICIPQAANQSSKTYYILDKLNPVRTGDAYMGTSAPGAGISGRDK